jgi:DNA-binding response OmpR family regulator
MVTTSADLAEGSDLVLAPLWALSCREPIVAWLSEDLLDLLRRIPPSQRGTDPGILIAQVGASVLKIDRTSARATVDGTESPLSRSGFLLLEALLLHAGKPVSVDRLKSSVWGASSGYCDVSLRALVHDVRATLGPTLTRSLRTVRGVGYCWTSPQRKSDYVEPTHTAAGAG